MYKYEEIMDDLYIVANKMKLEGEEVDELVNEMITSSGNILAETSHINVRRKARSSVLDFRKLRDKSRTKLGSPQNFGGCDTGKVIDATVSTDNPLKNAINKEMWDSVQEVLNSTQEKVVSGRVIYGKTFSEIGKDFGKTESWASQVFKQSVGVLKARLGEYDAAL